MRKIIIAIITAFAVLSACAKTDYSYDIADGIISEIRDTISGVSINYAFDGVLEFIPDTPKAGLVFYPGAYVDYRCYAQLMAALAKEGFLCILPSPSLDLALLNLSSAVGLSHQYPEARKWYIGGHSLGGASAAMCLASHPDDFEGLVLLAAYSTKDISMSGKEVISIYGSNDGVLNMKKYNEYRKNLPEDFIETVIEGGNHGYFAIYGHQDGDGDATISRSEQIRQTASAISRLLDE